MLKQRHQLFVTLFACTDAVSAAGACAAAWWVRHARFGSFDEGTGSYLQESLTGLVVPIFAVVMYTLGLYRPRRDRALIGEFAGVVRASFIAMVAVIVLIWLTGGQRTPVVRTVGPVIPVEIFTGPFRYQILILSVMLPSVISLQRLALRIFLRMIRRGGRNTRHVAVLGVGRLGQITARTLERNSWTGIRVAYFISHHEQTNRTTCIEKTVRGGTRELEAILERYPVDAIYIALPNAMSPQLPQILQRLERFAVEVRLIPDVRLRYLPQSMAVSELEGMPILSYRESPLTGIGGMLKRLIDIFGSLAAMIIFLPVVAAIIVAMKLTTKGPVFFRQRRVSLGGDTFWIYKFRTMIGGSQNDPTWTQEDDPRVTKIGHWLRKTSLDELPQLLNVLIGDMSLVGPRPERPELIDRFREDWRGYMIRQHVKAGMTGWAQVNGLRGNTSLRKRLQYDLFYIRNWSILFDLRILCLTIVRGFIHKNAY
ncbi:MAG: undecaprenyl-phosphate glucose phosphotransferase [Phycisphaerales bacterium]|nr:undecaprenyl-phosphate glucose phosphotransferase [Phycisphaerales bacterium]